MPTHLSIFSFQFSPSPARHYHPTLSIWLSVDPMSDKYPSTFSYTYCRNNPVRLIDEDSLETPDNQEYANSLIAKAQEVQANYEKGSEGYNKLQEGIDGLTYMREVEAFTFSFSEAKNIDHIASREISEGNVTCDDNRIFHIHLHYSRCK